MRARIGFGNIHTSLAECCVVHLVLVQSRKRGGGLAGSVDEQRCSAVKWMGRGCHIAEVLLRRISYIA